LAAGSIVGTFIGSQLLGLVSNGVLLPLLAALLLISSVKVWRHKYRDSEAQEIARRAENGRMVTFVMKISVVWKKQFYEA
jgi:uncharacterized membrane protein YfcA